MPNKEEYVKRERVFVNGISIAADQFSDVVYDGYKVSDLFTGANFLIHIPLTTMVISILDIWPYAFRILQYCTFLQDAGNQGSQCIHHHAGELWTLVKTCTFPDGRLCRIGGDSRVRYCYCQDYLVPALLYARDALGDTDAYMLESKWREQMLHEQSLNADRSYLGDRAKNLRVLSPLYYTRLESDRAAVASMGYLWNKFLAKEGLSETNRIYPILDSWHEEYHGACMTRGNRRIASFVWSGGEGPTGLCVPPDKSDMAEWRQNMAAQVIGRQKQDGTLKRNGIRSTCSTADLSPWGKVQITI